MLTLITLNLPNDDYLKDLLFSNKKMKQIVQTLKNGKIQVLDCPPPLLGRGMILVNNHFSLISAGTEMAAVRLGQKNLVGKALDKPQQVVQVLDSIKDKGVTQTYRAVRKRLDAYSPLGYSCSGRVLEVASDVNDIITGDFVACGGGGYANHAEVVVIPKNLCVRLRPDADLKQAAFNTLGAVALQGIRQAGLRLGESCVVIGLGLIGQLTCLLLRANGVRVVGVDIDRRMVELAGENCVDLSLLRSDLTITGKIFSFSNNLGADAVIITAASKSKDPINFAGSIARKKGVIVIVGDIPTGFDREDYYKKELLLKMSCSYGPGRYDSNYEEKGIDYPAGYVRWTEKRNMEVFQDLIHSKKIDIEYLISHIYSIDTAIEAYDLINNKDVPNLGVLIEYKESEITKTFYEPQQTRPPEAKTGIAFVGVGSYALSYLLPHLPKKINYALKGILDSVGTVSKKCAEQYGFAFSTSDEKEIFGNEEINTVFIASRHDSHAKYVLKGIKSGKNVHVEKPLCLNPTELDEINEEYYKQQKLGQAPRLIVGFNRRFSPLTEKLKSHLHKGPMAMLYRINSGYVPSDSWIQDHEIGGGRIIGEVCHFIDYLTFLNGSLPKYISAHVLREYDSKDDTVSINLEFENGSIGSILYFANGSKSVAKEYIEVYQSGLTGILRDFKELEIFGKGKLQKKKLKSPDKGQKNMLSEFLKSIESGAPCPIRFEEIYYSTLTSFKIVESIKKNEVLPILQ